MLNRLLSLRLSFFRSPARGHAFLLVAMGLAVSLTRCSLPPLSRATGTDGGSTVGDGGPVGPGGVRCTTTRSSEKIPQRTAAAVATTSMEASALLEEVKSMCSGCHEGDNDTPFRFTPTLDGLRDAAQRTRMIMQTISGAMPPHATPAQQKSAVQLGEKLQAWANQGYPNGSFSIGLPAEPGGGTLTQIPVDVARAMTDLGNCIPDPETQGRRDDPDKDAFFASLTRLPAHLSETDTDVYTFDMAKMAARGTYAYAPTYQLWADDAKKLRLVHVPQGKSIEFDPATSKFKIPPNTRFYKTFFKKVIVDKSRLIEYRKFETRLIVTRERWEDALFGTYIWNEDETSAELHDLRYRDGTPFTDRVLVYSTEENLQAGMPVPTRNYAVPGSARCIQCHMGAEAQDFVLGFTPLQVNRRDATGGGWVDYERFSLEEDQLSQVDRLLRYGVISGVRSAAELPKLEDMGRERQPRSPEELAVQAYMVGNCAHCHNANGFATVSSPDLSKLDFGPGGLFQFSTDMIDTNGARYIDVSTDNFMGTFAGSLFKRVNGDTNLETIHMPTNVPGKDCRLSVLLGEWFATLELDKDPPNLTPAEKDALRAKRKAEGASYAQTECTVSNDVYWVAEDQTDKVPYHPRNADWRVGIGNSFISRLNLNVTPELEALAKKEFYTNFWTVLPGCKFPVVPDSAYPGVGSPEPWMLDDFGYPRQNWGELYSTIPGESVYDGVCASCHGPTGNGQSGASKVLVALSGYRVADLSANLFGPIDDPGQNLHTFDELGAYGAAKYLVWMGAGGTKVRFPKGFMSKWLKGRRTDIDWETRTGDSSTVESFGANMLAATKNACDLIRRNQFGMGGASPPPLVAGTTLWREICTTNNPLTPDILAGTRGKACPDATMCVDDWLDHAQFNAGVMAYFYLRDSVTRGTLWPLRTQCNLRKP